MKNGINPQYMLVSGLLVLAAGISSTFGTPIITVPAGLNPGDHYRLAFVTDGLTNAASTEIATYNAFVTQQAALAPELASLGTTWNIIGQTWIISAFDNTNNGSATSPIYGLDGLLIATDHANLWSGILGPIVWSASLINPIKIAPSGANRSGATVWTGSYPDGLQGGEPLGYSNPQSGLAGHSGRQWVLNYAWDSPQLFPVYGISGDLTATPEPGSAILFATGLLAVALQRRRRQVVPGGALSPTT
jgi:hypothetical protein